MADNILDISYLNPLKFRKQGYTNPLPYNTKFFDDFNYPDTIQEFEELVPYLQPFQKNDIIYLQLLSNYGPHQVELYTCDGVLVDSLSAGYVMSSVEGIGVKVYQLALALNSYDEGIYYCLIKSGSPVLEIYESEKFELKQLHPLSFQLKYKHNKNDYDVVFETGIEFQARFQGGLDEWKPATDRTVFIDQISNIVQLSAKYYELEKLIFGDYPGTPKYIARLGTNIFRCSNVLVDGKQYVIPEGANPEARREANYPLAGWVLDVRPAISTNKKRFVASGQQGSPTTVVYQIDGQGFGSITNPASSNIIQIESLE